MRIILALTWLALVAGCSIRLTESEVAAFFDRQKGRVLLEAQTLGCEAISIRDHIIEYVPRELPRAGWAVVWQVNTAGLADLNAASSEKVVGMIVSWRIIGDRTKVRIPVSYSAG